MEAARLRIKEDTDSKSIRLNAFQYLYLEISSIFKDPNFRTDMLLHTVKTKSLHSSFKASVSPVRLLCSNIEVITAVLKVTKM